MEDTPQDVRQLLQSLMTEVSTRKASDVHIGPNFVPMPRINGELEPAEMGQPMTADQTRELAHFIMGENRRSLFEERSEIDLAFSMSKGGRFRVNIYSQVKLEDALAAASNPEEFMLALRGIEAGAGDSHLQP